MYINLFLAHKINHWYIIKNDPSAGSPTETLLRLLLPLNAQVWESSRAALEVETSKGPVQIPH